MKTLNPLKLLVLLLCAGFITHLSHAQTRSPLNKGGGQHVGNGGDVVFCPSGQPFQIMALDLYEAMVRFKSKKQLVSINWQLAKDDEHPEGFKNIGAEDLAYKLLAKDIQIPIPQRQVLQVGIENWTSQAAFLEDIELNDVPDSQHVGIPEGCKIRQLVVQGPLVGLNFNLQDIYYIVDQALWAMLPRFQQAMMILHEMYYRDEVLRGATNSLITRFIVGSIATEFLQKTKDEKTENFSLRGYVIPQVLIDRADTTEWKWTNLGLVHKEKDLVWCQGGLSFGGVMVADSIPQFETFESQHLVSIEHNNLLQDCFSSMGHRRWHPRTKFSRKVFVADSSGEKLEYREVTSEVVQVALSPEQIATRNSSFDSAFFIDKVDFFELPPFPSSLLSLDSQSKKPEISEKEEAASRDSPSSLQFVFAPRPNRLIQVLGQNIDLSQGAIADITFKGKEGAGLSLANSKGVNIPFFTELQVAGISTSQKIGISRLEFHTVNDGFGYQDILSLNLVEGSAIEVETGHLTRPFARAFVAKLKCTGDLPISFLAKNNVLAFYKASNLCRPLENLPSESEIKEVTFDSWSYWDMVGKKDFSFSVGANPSGLQFPKRIVFDDARNLKIRWGISEIWIPAKEVSGNLVKLGNVSEKSTLKFKGSPGPGRLKSLAEPSGVNEFKVMLQSGATIKMGSESKVDILPVASTELIPAAWRDGSEKVVLKWLEFDDENPRGYFLLSYTESLKEQAAVFIDSYETQSGFRSQPLEPLK